MKQALSISELRGAVKREKLRKPKHTQNLEPEEHNAEERRAPPETAGPPALHAAHRGGKEQVRNTTAKREGVRGAPGWLSWGSVGLDLGS